MGKSNGKIWPYAIAISIFIVFIAAIATIIIANKLPVEDSDAYMMNYHEADAKANDLIQARINFDKLYNIKFIPNGLNLKSSTIQYHISDKDLNPVNNAIIKIIVTRPNKHKFDQEFTNANILNGVYTFSNITLEKEGRWDIMAKITIGDKQRFFNVKADTRAKDAYEY
jgi:nitrogen fixation protein FixH